MTQNDKTAENPEVNEAPESGDKAAIPPQQEPSQAAADSQARDVAKELDEMKNRYYRALADYQNIVKRSAKEQLEARGRGVEDFLKRLLPVLDTLDKAMEQIGKCNVDKKVMDGLEMFSIQFSDVLEKEGLKTITAHGSKFDPNFHEALCKRTVEDKDDEIVLNVFEKGYTFKERLLRTAKVEINQK
ncbi:MAG TPA: nucleotide exchange factor GrpE [Candidatus Rifleibacterium sp.]|nr:nucleotide exchange factor GrpE [Candidatus Rifleibacterium sp.]HPT46643.1 nucleotide exchange factor GrpE [Candidatus Rifleibacterium sp.]